jgi:transposase-like protein
VYALQKIDPDQWEQIPELIAFYDDLAKKPYCSNERGFCYPRTKAHAIRHGYIQPNFPDIVKWLVFDIDHPNALFAYHDLNLPRPQLIEQNPDNGHAHYGYKLTEPVLLWGNAGEKPINYLRGVHKALNKALGGDPSYSGNLIKNPFSPSHNTYITGAKPSYTLDELASYLDLEYETADPIDPAQNDDQYGRNCATFEYTRHKAYPIAQQYTQAQLFKEILAIALEFNAHFDVPMFENEVRHIAWSIARYCKSGRFGVFSEKSKARFSKRQSLRVKRANKKGACNKGGLARSANYNDQRTQAQKLRAEGLSIRKIAELLKVSKTSVQKWINV